MRNELTKTLQCLPEASKAVGSIRAMRAACRKFLEEPHLDFPYLAQGRSYSRFDQETSPGFFVALGELRASFGQHVAALSVQYGIDLEEELSSTLPVEDEF